MDGEQASRFYRTLEARTMQAAPTCYIAGYHMPLRQGGSRDALPYEVRLSYIRLSASDIASQ